MEKQISSFAPAIEEMFTFDDVLLVPAYSQVLPREVNIESQLTTGIRLNAPVVSAAMDTVTEKKLAIAIAREGGIGMIHKDMSIESQADQVRSVKRSESGMIIDPITLKVGATVKDARIIMDQYGIGGIPIIDEKNHRIGILTNRDLRFETILQRPITVIMTEENLITAPKGTTLEQAKGILQNYKVEKLPVVDEYGLLIGLITYKDIMRLEDYPLSCKDTLGRLVVGGAVGVNNELHDRVDALEHVGVDVICIDTAHGHSQGVLNAVKSVRSRYAHLEIIGGNVATAEGAIALKEAGVNGV